MKIFYRDKLRPATVVSTLAHHDKFPAQRRRPLGTLAANSSFVATTEGEKRHFLRISSKHVAADIEIARFCDIPLSPSRILTGRRLIEHEITALPHYAFRRQGPSHNI